MAHRLIDAGTPLRVYNRTRGRAEPFAERGATVLDSLTDAADCDIVLSVVADDAALAAVHDEEEGLFSGASAPAIWIDCSTVSPDAAERAATAARAAGSFYVAAPVSGNPGVVAAGTAIYAVSGDTTALDLAEPLLRRIGRDVMRVGTSVEASVVKLCVNAVLAVTIQSLAEVAVLADRAGVSRADLMAFLNESAIGSPFSRYKTRNLVTLDFPATFTPAEQRKDVWLALSLARTLEVPMPVLATTETAFSRLVAGGIADGQDYAALVVQAARDAGHELRAEPWPRE